ncbi:hypothetical protein BH23GEM3_BH23GEM3_11760 [soil metagenome]
MMPDAGSFLLLLLWGGWVAIDSTSVGQLMVSRPVVAASVAGWIAGDPVGGALLGLMLEALQLTVLPFGAARYSEAGPAAVVGAGVLAGHATNATLLLLTVFFALSWGWVGGNSVRNLRQFNVRLIARAGAPGSSPSSLERWHAVAILTDYLRGMLLVGTGVPLLALFLMGSTTVWGLNEPLARIAVWAAVAAGCGATLRLFGAKRRFLFAAGVLCGSLFLLLV